MFIIAGERQFGKVDYVPGLFYVSTKFMHINFCPLVPTRSYLIFDGTETDQGFRGIPLGIRFNSVLMAWFRFMLIIGSAAAGIGGMIQVADHPQEPNGYIVLALPIAGVLLYILSYRFARIGPRRALTLAEIAGLDLAAVAQHFMPPEAADETK